MAAAARLGSRVKQARPAPRKTTLIDLELDRLGIQLAALSETWWYSSGSIEKNITPYFGTVSRTVKSPSRESEKLSATHFCLVWNSHYLSPRVFTCLNKEETIAITCLNKKKPYHRNIKQVRNVVLHYKETGNYAKQCRCTVTTNSNHKASKNKQDLQLCVKILVTPD